jgi:hypothetical protein
VKENMFPLPKKVLQQAETFGVSSRVTFNPKERVGTGQFTTSLGYKFSLDLCSIVPRLFHSKTDTKPAKHRSYRLAATLASPKHLDKPKKHEVPLPVTTIHGWKFTNAPCESTTYFDSTIISSFILYFFKFP